LFSWLLGFPFKVWCDSDVFTFEGKLVFFSCNFHLLSLFFSLGILIIRWHGEVLFWSCLFGILNVSCTWMSISFLRFWKFSATISLNRFYMLYICI
jgi:hypothetical protein